MTLPTDAAFPSVNDLLSNLRQSNKSQNDKNGMLLSQAATMPPAVRHALQLPDTPEPRPRMPRRTDANGRRLPAGPRPPSSWTETPKRSIIGARQQSQGRNHPENVMHLPGANAPRGLVDTCLRRMAEDWGFHSDYNTYYLATMPTRLRVLLLSYIAVYGPDEGVGIEGLNNILRPPPGANAEDDFSGNDNFRRLDVSCAIGRSISFSQLSESIISPEEEASEETWEIRSNPTSFLPFLTHLSLSHPPPNISWTKFLSFAKNVPTLTHLSLAYWPVPSLTPNSKTATISPRYGTSVQYGGTSLYSHSLDGDWSEAAGILKRLSWSLYNLEWLSLDGCTEWAPALRWKKSGINWKEHWSKIRSISLKSSYNFGGSEQSEAGMQVSNHKTLSSQEFLLYKEAILEAVAVETHIRRQRGWITVEHDDWEKHDDWIWTNDSSMAAKMLALQWDEKMQKARFSRDEKEKTAGNPAVNDSNFAF